METLRKLDLTYFESAIRERGYEFSDFPNNFKKSFVIFWDRKKFSSACYKKLRTINPLRRPSIRVIEIVFLFPSYS